MPLGTRGPEAARAARSVRIALLALLVVAAVVAALFATGRLGGPRVTAENLSRVLLVGAAADENGDVVAQVIVVADASGPAVTLEPVSPALGVTIPGTSYDTLGDAYPFGGGAGVASALARSQGGDALPYVSLNANALADAIEGNGGVRLTLPAAISVFDGEELFTLSPGTQTLDARELGAVFKGAPYLSAAERAELEGELSRTLAALVSQRAYDALDTDLSSDAYAALQSSLAAAGR